jgi:hypothetical protein
MSRSQRFDSSPRFQKDHFPRIKGQGSRVKDHFPQIREGGRRPDICTSFISHGSEKGEEDPTFAHYRLFNVAEPTNKPPPPSGKA